ncbi:hypothetical protein FRC02_003795 [Tulasnella sp. 418]|nr:hypothetical protein FRC02_003795 [Tulasnella sp. 418]
MVASGPFALGPASLGTSSSKRPNQSFASVGLLGPSGAAALGTGLSGTAAPALKKELKPSQDIESLYADEEILSDEEGAEKVDMDHVSKLDWSAPVALRRRKDQNRGKKKDHKVKEGDSGGVFAKSRSQSATIDDDEEVKDEANALDLSESEEEEELEDLVEHFTRRNLEESGDEILSGEQLYLFQFPSPFPTFVPPTVNSDSIDVDAQPSSSTTSAKPDSPETDHKGKGKAVTWAPDVKNVEDSKPVKKEDDITVQHLDGIIGQIEVYRSGAIKMKLGSDIIMEVSAATQPTFLMQAVHIDSKHKRMMVVGEVSKKFIVSPDVEKMLDELGGSGVDGELKGDPSLEGLQAMDTTE